MAAKVLCPTSSGLPAPIGPGHRLLAGRARGVAPLGGVGRARSGPRPLRPRPFLSVTRCLPGTCRGSWRTPGIELLLYPPREAEVVPARAPTRPTLLLNRAGRLCGPRRSRRCGPRSPAAPRRPRPSVVVLPREPDVGDAGPGVARDARPSRPCAPPRRAPSPARPRGQPAGRDLDGDLVLLARRR